MKAPLIKENRVREIAVRPEVIVIGDGESAEAVVQALDLHTVFWIGHIPWQIHSNTVMYPRSTLLEVRGHVGNFHVKISIENKELWLDAGALVLAPRINFLLNPHIAVPASHRVKPVSTACIIDGQGLNIAFYLGEQEKEGFFSTGIALMEALRLVRNGARIYFLYTEMIVGRGLEHVYDACCKAGVHFLRYSDSPEVVDEGNLLCVHYTDQIATMLGRRSLAVDYLFVGEICRPSKEFTALAGVCEVRLNEEGYFQTNNASFFPLTTNRPGIFAVGSARGPLHTSDSVLDASAVAGELAGFLNGVRFPKKYASVTPNKCTSCLACYKLCPHRAIDIEEGNHAVSIDPLACQPCGMCSAVCPTEAISLPSFDELVQHLAAELNGKTIIFACENSGMLALYSTPLLTSVRDRLEIIVVPCAGSINFELLVAAIERGAEQVVLSVCPNGNCQHFYGNTKALEEVGKANNYYRERGIPQKRIHIIQASANDLYIWKASLESLFNQTALNLYA